MVIMVIMVVLILVLRLVEAAGKRSSMTRREGRARGGSRAIRSRLSEWCSDKMTEQKLSRKKCMQ
jgi:hypothetical protein